MNAIEKVLRRPVIAHLMAALNRFNKRLGPQFSAAITYFTVLSMVPILMFAFSMLGMTLTVFRPDLLDAVNELVDQGLDSTDTAEKVKQVIHDALHNWRGTGVFALLTAAYSGAGWAGNLKRALRVMWRDRFSDAAVKRNIVVETLINLGIFLGILLCVGVSLGVTIMGGTLSQSLIGWLNLGDVPGISLLFRVVSILLAFLASWIMFSFLFFVLPGERTNLRTFLIGSAAGALAATALQQLAGFLVGVFSGNSAVQIFGPAIVVFLMFNLLAQIILIAAAWVGTADTWESDQLKQDVENALDKSATEVDVDDPEPVAVPRPKPITATEQLKRDRFAARRSLDDLKASNFDPEKTAAPESMPVSAEAAERSVKVSYGLGAAAGVGIGAFLTWVANKILRR